MALEKTPPRFQTFSRNAFLFGLCLLAAFPLRAQHDHGHQSPKPMDMAHDTMPMEMPMMMSSALSLSLPMNRNGSGTGWQPDSTPMFGSMKHTGKWMWMTHGDLFLRYTSQNFNNDDKRGSDQQFDAPNWLMFMAQRPVGANGLFAATTMFSIDRLTMGGDGYPLLFQTGESWKGEPLVDRQHPHDIFTNLSVSYGQRLSEKADLFGYFGFPGEPALGPVAFMHRGSAIGNPAAPLGHHWQDATHITFGVGTLGFRYGILKVEGSIFTGREPDENRYDFDKPRFDSYSYRLSVNPTGSLALQFSQGFLESPELLHPGEDVTRTTASISHSKSFGNDQYLLSTLVYGLNSAHEQKAHSLGLESSLILPRFIVYDRYEFVQKSTEELNLVTEEGELFNVHAFTQGLAYRLASFAGINLHVGGQVTLHLLSDELERLYGSMPLSGEVYLRFSPTLMGN